MINGGRKNHYSRRALKQVPKRAVILINWKNERTNNCFLQNVFTAWFLSSKLVFYIPFYSLWIHFCKVSVRCRTVKHSPQCVYQISEFCERRVEENGPRTVPCGSPSITPAQSEAVGGGTVKVLAVTGPSQDTHQSLTHSHLLSSPAEWMWTVGGNWRVYSAHSKKSSLTLKSKIKLPI